LIRGNPVFSTGFPVEFTLYLIRGGNDRKEKKDRLKVLDITEVVAEALA
jgi:hypothetical protein